MPSDVHTASVDHAFFLPLDGLAAASPHALACREFPDDAFIRLGIQRVLELSPSGRGFLQEHGPRFPDVPGHANYFASLGSPRRLEVLRDVGRALVRAADPVLTDRLAGIPELERYACFAADGHWHKAAAHDPRHDGVKMAVGHFYGLNLRTHTLRHLAAAEGLHENDMSALKRIKPKGLRQGVPKGTRVIIVYDKAGIDFGYWDRCRRECALFFISRVKENMIYDWIQDVPVDATDARNHGVCADRRISTREGHLLRIVRHTDPVGGESYEFLTNVMDLPAGVVAELYRRRWEAEKVFDEIKNRLAEKKAWASSLTGKETQAQMVVLTHNLLLLYGQRLENEHGITNRAEDLRREQRTDQAAKLCAMKGLVLPALVQAAKRASQHSLKFIRWLRRSLRDKLTEHAALPLLRTLYASS